MSSTVVSARRHLKPFVYSMTQNSPTTFLTLCSFTSWSVTLSESNSLTSGNCWKEPASFSCTTSLLFLLFGQVCVDPITKVVPYYTPVGNRLRIIPAEARIMIRNHWLFVNNFLSLPLLRIYYFYIRAVKMFELLVRTLQKSNMPSVF